MRADRLLPQDISDAIDETIQSTPSTWAKFESDKFRNAFVLRQIQIIGEACWRLGDGLRKQHPGVPWRQIIGMRDVLVHDYFEVNRRRVYEAARNDVPPLRAHVENILASLPPPSESRA